MGDGAWVERLVSWDRGYNFRLIIDGDRFESRVEEKELVAAPHIGEVLTRVVEDLAAQAAATRISSDQVREWLFGAWAQLLERERAVYVKPKLELEIEPEPEMEQEPLPRAVVLKKPWWQRLCDWMKR